MPRQVQEAVSNQILASAPSLHVHRLPRKHKVSPKQIHLNATNKFCEFDRESFVVATSF